ncbi:hypothetical protein [uncultured Sphingomonas sp.]|uniref:hypothetical protein n=1 Tax=uncultured Sphingomonas sp. TaxID=158754 RepID=UPI0025E77F48|nr:hypothetical protein [uncultured Sphingomonas sp.]
MADSTEQTAAPNVMPVSPLAVPRFWCTQFSIIGSDHEVVLAAGSLAVMQHENGDSSGVVIPALQMSLSPLSAKELSAILAQYVEQYEANHGPLKSEFVATLGQADT